MMVFAVGFFSVFAEGARAATCSFNPNIIQGAPTSSDVTFSWEGVVGNALNVTCVGSILSGYANAGSGQITEAVSVNDGQYTCWIPTATGDDEQCSATLYVETPSCGFFPSEITSTIGKRTAEFRWTSIPLGLSTQMTLSCLGMGIQSHNVSGRTGSYEFTFRDDESGTFNCRLLYNDAIKCSASLSVAKKGGSGGTCQEKCSTAGKNCYCYAQATSCNSSTGTKVDGTFTDCPSPKVCCALSGSSTKTCTYNGKSGTCIASAQTCSGESGPASDNKCETATEKCCVSSSSSTCNASYCKTDCNASTDDTTQTACKSVCTDSSKPNYCPPKSTTTTTTTTTTTSSGTSVSITLANPLKYSTVQQVLMALLYALQGVIVVLSLVFIVIGAVLYITSGGNQGRVTMAKTAITAALIGLAIGILAPTFLKEIATVLGWNSTAPLPSEVSSARSAADILLSVLNFLLGIVGVLSIIMLVVGGVMFLTAAGSQDRITTGKKIVTYALLGVVVALASLVIVRQLATFFAA